MLWAIRFFPRCASHVFLSHCAEDRGPLVFPVHDALRARGVVPWLDRHDYPYGRGSRAALRDSVLACRHAVFFVTDAMLTQARGWCVQELAWAELLQDNLVQPGGPALVNVLLPLYFVDPADPRLPRTVWQAARDKGPFCPPAADPPGWAAGQIEAFLRREADVAARYHRYARRDPGFRGQVRAVDGLHDRVTRFDPGPLPTV